MKTARICTIKNTIAIAALAAATAALTMPSQVRAAAGGPQSCTVNTNCTVGEFLYNDSYAPILDATCTITSRDPNGTVYHNAQTMTAASDGWYAYSFTAPETTGYYRSQICCTSGNDYLCIDKSFEVVAAISNGGTNPTADEIAQEVWGYSNRTLSGFGTLASDVWSNSSRSLTSFGSLVTNVWDNASRTLTGTQGTNITDVNADLKDIEKKVNENRLLLERLVNQPIIETSLEEENDIPDLSKKLEDAKTTANQMYINQQFVMSKVDGIISDWDKSTQEGLLLTVMDLNKVVGEENDHSNNTLIGQVNWFKDAWNWNQVDDIYTQTLAVKKTLSSIQTTLGTSDSGLSKTKANSILRDFRSVSLYLGTLEKLVGDSTNQPTQKTLFGKIKETETLASVLESRSEEADKLLSSWGRSSNIDKKINDLSTKVLAINRIPKATAVLASSYGGLPEEKQLKNKLLGIRALIGANKLLLAKGAGVSFANTWLEEGSVVFKTLITNPSNLIGQEVPLKYYLPKEVKEEDILAVDDGLKVNYDAEKGQYFVEGTFKLAAGESRAVSVRVEDIWEVTQAEIDSLRKQAEELSKPLEKTSYFAQGVTLTSDISVSLDKIGSIQKQAITPEQKIRAYREAQIELTGVTEKMDKLKELVTQAGSTGTMFGFVGGAQALAVWGLIIIMAAGFVFLALYMKLISSQGKIKSREKSKDTTEHDHKDHKGRSDSGSAFPRIFRVAVPFVIVGVLTAAVSGLAVRSIILSQQQKTEVESGQQSGETIVNEEKDTNDENVLGDGTGGESIIRIFVPQGKKVNIYQEESEKSDILLSLVTDIEVTKVSENGNWVKVAFEKTSTSNSITEGFVNKESVIEAADQEATDTTITVKPTSTGWLRVRQDPDGKEIAKVNSGESFNLVSQSTGWYQIELTDGTIGWISSAYASLNE